MDRLGLFLVGVVVWATDRLADQRPAGYPIKWAAHAALAGVTVVGSVVDWLTLSPSRPKDDRRDVHRAPATR
jgi:hypothetical protein